MAEILLALKWIGNAGSHSQDIQPEDIFDGIELLEKIVEKLYSDNEKELAAKVKEINKKKSPIN